MYSVMIVRMLVAHTEHMYSYIELQFLMYEEGPVQHTAWL